MQSLILFILLTYIYSTKTTKWTAKELVQAFNNSPNKQMLDPDLYLEDKTLDEKTLGRINSLESENKFKTKIFLIAGISEEYKSFLSIDIERFTDELSREILKGDKQAEYDSMFIVFSINDRIMRIRTGSNVKSYLPDSKAQDYLDAIKSYLRDSKYSQAVNILMEKIYERITSPYTIYWDILEYAPIIIIVVVLLVIYIYSYCKNRVSKPAATRLNRIQRICRAGKPKREIIETTCVICLEEFSNNTEIASQENVNRSDLEEHLNNKNPMAVVRLECGHPFHFGCIAEWSKNHNTCPTCREKIDNNEEDDQMLSQNLVAVQTSLFPDIIRARVRHGSSFRWRNEFWWTTSSTYGTSSSGTSRGWNLFSGGATSRW
jgi:uncharacterized membrane protein YgcG